jgi:hypothetical protein
MRRGLMAWDADELPLDALKARLLRLQAAMAARGQDALLLYTNFIRSGAVSYITAFSPYWADGVLLVPQRGEPVFATTLSKRVASWIQSVKPIGELVNSPTPGAVLGKRLAADGAKRVAVLELDAFPAGLYDELAAALPGVDIVDGGESFAAARSHLDAAERRLLSRADLIARDALSCLNLSNMTEVGVAVGAVERYARLQGAEEVYVAIARDLDADRRFVRVSGPPPLGRRFALRATVAYKGAWVRRAKTYPRDEKDRLAVGRADAWFKRFIARIDVDRALGDQLVSALADFSGARLTGWIAEAVNGTRPLAVVASESQPNESVRHVPALVITLALDVDGMPWCAAGLAGLVHAGKSA